MDKTDFLKRLGLRIAQIRKEKNLSQVEVANLMNKDAQSLGRVERGEINPTAYYLFELSVGLKVSVDDFFKDI